MALLKSFKFWVLFLFIIYTSSGFLLLPWIITEKVPPILKEKIDLHVSIKKAYINPFNFKIQLDTIQIKDRQNNPAISLEKLLIDYDLLALLEKKILFKEFGISNPKLIINMMKDGKLNLNNLVKIPSSDTQEKSSDESSLPLVYLDKFYIEKGSIIFNDLRKKKPFKIDLGPYDFSAFHISTAPGNINSHNFETSFKEGGKLFWEGGMSLKPLKFYGELNIKELALPKLYKYTLPEYKAHLQSAYLGLHLPYNINLAKEFELLINGANISLSNVRIADKNSKKILLKTPLLAVKDIDFAWPKQSATIKSVTLKNPSVFATLTKDKKLDLLKTFMPPKTEKQEKKKENSKNNFAFLLKDFFIEEGNFQFTDSSIETPLGSKLSNTSLHVEDISSNKELPILAKLQSTLNRSAKISLEGDFLQKNQKLTTDLDINNFDISHYEPYIKPFTRVKIKKGTIGFTSKIQAQFNESLKLQSLSNLKLNDVEVAAPDDKKLLSWKNLFINEIDYIHEPMALNVGNVALDEPYVRLHIAKDGTTNFSNLAIPQKKAQKEKMKKEDSSPLNVALGPMKLTKGKSDFSDFSLPFPFKTKIHDLHGQISTLDFKTTKPSKVSMEGKIDKYGYTKITGDLLPFKVKKKADISILFKNINLPSFSPYTGKFVGYAIGGGKLSMDLNYNIENATLKGDNKINIDSLTLGEKVESPDAANLPLGLAIALLKDSKGQIDIDMPVKGDMNNPEFSYGGVIWRAIGNLITGIVTAPFKFLGNMLGIDGEELKSIDFALGSAKVISTEHEKLVNLEKIMAKRPKIKLSIQGSYDETLDTQALQNIEFKKILQKRQKELTTKDEKADTYALALKALYLQEFNQEKYEELEKSFIDKKTKKVDITSVNSHIKELLSSRIEIKKQALLNLAQKRADTLKETLHIKYKIQKERITTKEPIITQATRDKWVEVKLDITT